MNGKARSTDDSRRSSRTSTTGALSSSRFRLGVPAGGLHRLVAHQLGSVVRHGRHADVERLVDGLGLGRSVPSGTSRRPADAGGDRRPAPRTPPHTPSSAATTSPIGSNPIAGVVGRRPGRPSKPRPDRRRDRTPPAARPPDDHRRRGWSGPAAPDGTSTSTSVPPAPSVQASDETTTADPVVCSVAIGVGWARVPNHEPTAMTTTINIRAALSTPNPDRAAPLACLPIPG